MERVLHRIFGLGADELRRERAPGGQRLIEGAPHLRPEVLRVSRVAAQLERNQVVFLIVRRRFVQVAGGAELLILEDVGVAGRRSDGLGRPVRVADGVVDVRLRDVGVRGARREDGIGIQGAGPHPRPGLTRRHDDMSAVVAGGSERGSARDDRGGCRSHDDQMG